MIRYTLRCENDHSFDSWFQSSSAYETLKAARQLACPDCGSAHVDKVLMAPNVRPARTAAADREPVKPDLSHAGSDREAALKELREQIEANSDYVGLQFASEARAMHDGVTPMRSIYGEARIDEARKLIEDGVPVARLPFTPRSKTN